MKAWEVVVEVCEIPCHQIKIDEGKEGGQAGKRDE